MLSEYLFTLQIKIIVTHRPLSFCWLAQKNSYNIISGTKTSGLSVAIQSSLNATDKGYSTKAHLSLSPSFIPLRRCHTGTLKLKVSLLFLSTGQNNPSPVIQCFHRELQIIFRVLQFSRFKHFHRDATYLPCFNPSLDFGCA